MFNIRTSTFETNSSSSHSIVVTKQDHPIEKIEDCYHVLDGKVDFWDRDLQFGRSPFDVLTNWYGRLCYAIASFGEERLEEIENACRRHIPSFKGFDIPKYRPWWNEGEEERPYYGEIDHQSMGLLQSFLFKHDLSLEDFIFNDRYIVIIDGDEYCVFDTLMETPMFTPDAIEDMERA